MKKIVSIIYTCTNPDCERYNLKNAVMENVRHKPVIDDKNKLCLCKSPAITMAKKYIEGEVDPDLSESERSEE